MSAPPTFVIVGAGLAGAKAAETLRAEGFDGRLLLLGDEPERPYDRTLIGRDVAPLAHVLGPEVGRVYREVHAEHGVRLVLGAGVAAFVGGAVEAVITGDGRTIPAVAWHPRYQTYLRVEHWANALHQGPAAARSMLGATGAYERIPYFFSDQYDLGMEYSAFIAFWVKDQRVVAGTNVNVWDVVEPIQDLIRSRRPVDPAQLANPDIPLEALAGEQDGHRLGVRSP